MKNDNLIVGKEVFHEEPGTLLELVSKPDDADDRIGTIVMRTDENSHPLMDLEDGCLWGDRIDHYTFKKVKKVHEIWQRLKD